MPIIQIGNIEVVKEISGSVSIINGRGSVFTYQASGQPGDSVTVYGSNDQENWTWIATLTIDEDGLPASTVEQHTFAYLQRSGNAKLTIARGEA